MNWRELPVIRVVRRAGHRYRRFLDRPAAERGAELAGHSHGIYQLLKELRSEERVAHEAELDMQGYILKELGELRRRLDSIEEQLPSEDAASRPRRTAVVSRLKR